MTGETAPQLTNTVTLAAETLYRPYNSAQNSQTSSTPLKFSSFLILKSYTLRTTRNNYWLTFTKVSRYPRRIHMGIHPFAVDSILSAVKLLRDCQKWEEKVYSRPYRVVSQIWNKHEIIQMITNYITTNEIDSCRKQHLLDENFHYFTTNCRDSHL